MTSHCPSCRLDFSLEDFDLEKDAELLRCPKCGTALPYSVSSMLREELERLAVVCQNCHKHFWTNEIDYGLTGWVCPECGGDFPRHDQEKLDDANIRSCNDEEEDWLDGRPRRNCMAFRHLL